MKYTIDRYNKLMHGVKCRVRDFVFAHAHTKKSKWTLFLVSFAESSFLLIPADIFLMGILMTDSRRWVYYSMITSVASVLGGVFGYLLGYLFFESFGSRVVDLYHLEGAMKSARELYAGNAFSAIFWSGFLPAIPYKVFTIAGGLFKINFWVFLLASALSRPLRFFAVGYITKLYGEKIALMFFKYFNIGTLLLIILIVLFFLFK